MLLFVCEVIDQNLEENMTEINERADKCHELETHDEYAWDDVNNCKLDPARGREARKEDMEYFQKMHAYRKSNSPEVQRRDKEDADERQVD